MSAHTTRRSIFLLIATAAIIQNRCNGRHRDLTEISDEPAEPFESETDFIRFFTRICSSSGMTVDFTDDCAQLDTFTDLVSTDTIIAGQHFSYEWTTPKQIGRQAAVVSLSDLAGSGARRHGHFSLSLPRSWNGQRLRSLCVGFINALAEHDVSLKGETAAIPMVP